MKRAWPILMLSVAVLMITTLRVSTSTADAPSDTVFTYQGALQQNGTPANGLFQLNVTLWNSESGGSQIGSAQSFVDHPVIDGQFTLQLDFGADAFASSGRWLEIEIDGSPLTPRQPITRSPFSIQTRGIFVDNNLRVGIGTTSPLRTLDIADVQPVLRLTSNTESPPDSARLQLKRGIDSQSFGRKLGDIEFVNLNDQVEASISATRLAGASTRMDVSVGVGNTRPQMRITPELGVEFGAHFIKPPLAYGTISAAGVITSGSTNVLSVQHLDTGDYFITIQGDLQATDVMLVTTRLKALSTARLSGVKMLVQLYDVNMTLNSIDRDFSFVIFRP